MKKEELIFSLGGSGEIGEYEFTCHGNEDNQKWIIVDMGAFGWISSWYWFNNARCGFIIDKKDDLLGIVLTHAHEDHIGAVAHIWPHLSVKFMLPHSLH